MCGGLQTFNKSDGEPLSVRMFISDKLRHKRHQYNLSLQFTQHVKLTKIDLDEQKPTIH